MLNQWVKNQVITEIEQKWLIRCALPLAYWQAQLHRTQPKAKNKDLRQHYKDRVSQALPSIKQMILQHNFQAIGKRSYFYWQSN